MIDGDPGESHVPYQGWRRAIRIQTFQTFLCNLNYT